MIKAECQECDWTRTAPESDLARMNQIRGAAMYHSEQEHHAVDFTGFKPRRGSTHGKPGTADSGASERGHTENAWRHELNYRFPELFDGLDRAINSIEPGALPNMAPSTLELASKAIPAQHTKDPAEVEAWARRLTEDILRNAGHGEKKDQVRVRKGQKTTRAANAS